MIIKFEFKENVMNISMQNLLNNKLNINHIT